MVEPLPLVEVFMRCWPGSSMERVQDLGDVEPQLRAAHVQGKSRWAQVELDIEPYVQYLAERIPAGPAPAQHLLAINTTDLYLTCACVQGMASALSTFDRSFLSRVPAFIANFDSSPSFADEVTQLLRTRLLCADAGSQPGIVKYSGLGALTNWVRVAATRTAQGIRRNLDEHPAARVDEITLSAVPLSGTPEMENIRNHCQKEFKSALTEAFASLSAEQRNVLRLHYAGGLTGEQIAIRLSIGRATVVRWLTRAREHLMRETRRLLRLRLRLDSTEVDSFIHAALSQLEVSLTSLFRERAEDGDNPR